MAFPSYPSEQSFPLTFPSTPKFTRFQFREKWKTPFTESPHTGDIQIQKLTGSNKIEWEAELPPMRDGNSDIAVWIRFLMELQGLYGTFALDIQAFTQIDYVDGYTSGIPTVWRSRDSAHGWEFDKNRMLSGLTIRAREA